MSPCTSDIRSSFPRRAVIKTIAAGALATAFTSAGWAVEATARPNRETGSVVDLPKQVKLVFIFGRPKDPLMFEGYYVTNHLPLALKMPHCLAMENAQAVSDADDADPTFYRIATMTFASEADMVACISSEAGRATIADVANFATGGVTATIVSNIQTRGFTAVDGPSTTVDKPLRYEQRRAD